MNRRRVSGFVARIAALACALALVAVAPAQAATDSELLKNRPFAPTDEAILPHAVYPSTSADAPATGTGWTEAGARSALKGYLQVEYPNDVAKQNAGLAVYGNATAKQKIPDPQLRAAFAALRGTFADPAINHFLNAKTPGGDPLFDSTRYAGLPGSAVAAVGATGTSGQGQIVFNRRYQYESPFLLTNAWVHEPLHAHGDSTSSGQLEEAVASSFNELFYLRQLLHHPGLAGKRTELARFDNFGGVARLNSGLGSRLGLYNSNGSHKLFAGSQSWPQTNWSAWVKQLYSGFPAGGGPSASAQPLLAKYLANTHESGAPTCSAVQFSQALLDCINANHNGRISSATLVAAARAMKLNVGN
jgi:hypothetical protein